MPAPYYGNPEALRRWLSPTRGFTVGFDDFDADVELYDSIVRLKIEADLAGIFESYPDPDSTQKNVISVLWLYGMTDEIVGNKGAVHRGENRYQESNKTKYDELMENIRKGTALVPGAIRRTGMRPVVNDFTGERVTVTERTPYDTYGVLPHGLRR